MIDDNWELIEGDAAHAIEVLNYANQVNVIEALVHLLMHHHRGADGTCEASPSEMVLKEFHRTATLFLLEAPGDYRDCPVVVRAGDVVIHTPPPFEEVPDHVSSFFKTIRESWSEKTAQEIAAFCLWFINWVHPFKNGNGRTARAFCYACLCLKLGFVLPGRKTVIDLIMEQRKDYYRILKETDASYLENGSPDLTEMTAFVDSLLADQLTSI